MLWAYQLTNKEVSGKISSLWLKRSPAISNSFSKSNACFFLRFVGCGVCSSMAILFLLAASSGKTPIAGLPDPCLFRNSCQLLISIGVARCWRLCKSPAKAQMRAQRDWIPLRTCITGKLPDTDQEISLNAGCRGPGEGISRAALIRFLYSSRPGLSSRYIFLPKPRSSCRPPYLCP